MAYTYHGKRLEGKAEAWANIPDIATRVTMGGDHDTAAVEEGIAFSPVYHLALKKTLTKGGISTWLSLEKAN